MIRIAVTPEAYAVIAASRGSDLAKPLRSPPGAVCLWLDKTTANQLTALRGPSESYSDVILRLAALEACS
jgi:hypothetical protein